MKLLNSGDQVQVRTSTSGYVGPGELVEIAYGITWLVKVERNGVPTIITVKATQLCKVGEITSQAKSKKKS